MFHTQTLQEFAWGIPTVCMTTAADPKSISITPNGMFLTILTEDLRIRGISHNGPRLATLPATLLAPMEVAEDVSSLTITATVRGTVGKEIGCRVLVLAILDEETHCLDFPYHLPVDPLKEEGTFAHTFTTSLTTQPLQQLSICLLLIVERLTTDSDAWVQIDSIDLEAVPVLKQPVAPPITAN
jgi:hypothetical protein